MSAADTIAAAASGAGRAAITVVRLSGSTCAEIVTRLAGSVPPARRATLRRLRNADGDILDQAIVLWLPGPRSFTGEDCAEFHLHGGRAVLGAVLGAVTALGARLAEPGEFTRRAFVNGRLDLLEAEAIADLTAAETEAQRRQAVRQMEGAQSHVIGTWRERLTRLIAWQEALIDFPDEDLPADIQVRLHDELAALRTEILEASTQAARGRRVRDGVTVAILGAPNVGKSTLINALAERDIAIVSAQPGTTRDTLEARLQVAGVPVTLIDTAGIRESTDPIEAEGVRRALHRATDADVALLVAEAGAEHAAPDLSLGCRVIRVANKVDRQPPLQNGWAPISATTGEGLPRLIALLTEEVRALSNVETLPVLSRARHQASLDDAATHLEKAAHAALPELAGEELRLAARALGRILGTVDVESVLDVVFAQFCIGK